MAVQITYFVHGTTTDNESELSTGWLPGELSALGIQQAKNLGGQVEDKKFDALFCSDLKRAVDSAELGFGETYAVIPDARLRECNYGDLNGAPADSFKDGRMQEYVDTSFPNGESYKDVQARMADFLSFLKQHYDGKHIAIIAHEGPQLALDVLLGGKDWPQAIAENWRNTKAWKPGWEYHITQAS
ncbi:MAG: histidine phosphatase family protein [Patescibacteria group bacterium]